MQPRFVSGMNSGRLVLMASVMMHVDACGRSKYLTLLSMFSILANFNLNSNVH